MFMIMKGNVSQCNTVAHSCVFDLFLRNNLNFMAQKSILTTLAIMTGFGLFIGFVDNKNNIEIYH